MVINILHIAAHYGGGVGTTIANFLTHTNHTKYKHRVVCMERPSQKIANVVGKFKLDFSVGVLPHGWVDDADLVIVHWWTRPSINKIIESGILANKKTIFWSHVSGLYEPYLFTTEVLEYPDRFVFTTPLSFGSNRVLQAKQQFRVIWSTGGVEKYNHPSVHHPNNCLIIGYIGTVGYKKLHPEFLTMCKQISDRIPARFILCGGPDDKQIQKEATALGLHLNCVGVVDNVRSYLACFDVFGYPLRPDHFGTCEQALGEAMAIGLPCVVMSNPAEWHIVAHNSTGIIASTPKAYVEAIVKLYHNPELRIRLGRQAHQSAVHKYSTSRMINDWEELIEEVLNEEKI